MIYHAPTSWKSPSNLENVPERFKNLKYVHTTLLVARSFLCVATVQVIYQSVALAT